MRHSGAQTILRCPVAQLPPAVEEAQPLGTQTLTCPYQAQEGQGPGMQMYLISHLYIWLQDCTWACMAARPALLVQRKLGSKCMKKGRGKGTNMCYPEGSLLSFSYITSGLRESRLSLK